MIEDIKKELEIIGKDKPTIIGIRLDTNELKMLDELIAHLDTTKSKFFRVMLHQVYKELNGKR
tara:strand:- start:412 stop:600 length:189 start_codon:yes stop_codon:yes gene_type:complete